MDVKKIIADLKKSIEDLQSNPELALDFTREYEELTKAEKAKEVKREDGKVEDSEVRDAEETSLGAQRKDDMTPGSRQIVHQKQDLGEQITDEQDKKDKLNPKTIPIEVKKEELALSDEPHAPGSPEDSAHDVVEEKAPLQAEMKTLPYADEKAKFLAHLRTLKDSSELRSPENQAAGMEKAGMDYKSPVLNQGKPIANTPAPKAGQVPAKGSEIKLKGPISNNSINKLQEKGFRTSFQKYELSKQEFLDSKAKEAQGGDVKAGLKKSEKVEELSDKDAMKPKKVKKLAEKVAKKKKVK